MTFRQTLNLVLGRMSISPRWASRAKDSLVVIAQSIIRASQAVMTKAFTRVCFWSSAGCRNCNANLKLVRVN